MNGAVNIRDPHQETSYLNNGEVIIRDMLEEANNRKIECWSGDWSHDWSGNWPHESWSNNTWQDSHRG